MSNLRRIRRRTNSRKIIKGRGFLEYVRRKISQGREWAKRKLPAVVSNVKQVGKRHLEDLVKNGLPLNKEELLRRGKNLAGDVAGAVREGVRGSGKLKRLRNFSLPPAKRLRYR